VSTRAIKGAEVGVSNSRNADSLTGVCKTLREKRVGRIQKYELAEVHPPPLIDTDKWCEVV